MTLVACGNTSADDEREQLAEDLVSETGGELDDSTARCVADGLYEEFGDGSFERVLAAASGAQDDDEETRVMVIDIFASCDALAPIIDDSP